MSFLASRSPSALLKIDLAHIVDDVDDAAVAIPGSACSDAPSATVIGDNDDAPSTKNPIGWVPAETPVGATPSTTTALTPVDTISKHLCTPSASASKASRCTKSAWTPDEDAKLLQLIAQHGPSNWSRIAADMENRIGKQCRERWHNHLCPDVKTDSFSADEDRAIMEAVAAHGTKWADMVKLIPGRTDNAIKNRWNSTTRRIGRLQARCGGRLPGLGELDLNTMDASSIARHLLEHGIPTAPDEEKPPKSSAKASKRSRDKEGDAMPSDAADQPPAAEHDSATAPSTKRKRGAGGGARPRQTERWTARGGASSGLELLRAATLGSFRTESPAAAAAPARAGFTLDALAAVACSSEEGAELGAIAEGRGSYASSEATYRLCESGCRSPRMLEAAVALGGVCMLTASSQPSV